MHSLYRSTLRLAILPAVLAVAIAVSACGAGTHYVGNVLAHHAALDLAKTQKQKRDVNRAFCVYSVYRAFHDATHHHLIFGALNADQALHNCEAGFSKSAG